MSRAVEQAIVSEMADAFVGAGLADLGTYTPPGGSSAPVRVFISRLRQPFGDFGSAAGNSDIVTLLLSEVPSPQRGGVVVADGETFTLVRMIKQDASDSQWEVATS